MKKMGTATEGLVQHGFGKSGGSVLRTNFCAKKPAHRQSAKR
jgi:hypothetical protein